MTEEEAKTKYCPYLSNGRGQSWPCIASACMAWKWYGYYEQNKPEMIPIDRGMCGLVK